MKLAFKIVETEMWCQNNGGMVKKLTFVTSDYNIDIGQDHVILNYAKFLCKSKAL